MNVLHVTNEISKKNFSISSLIIFFINTLENVYPNINSQLLISNVEEDFIKINDLKNFEKKKIIKLNFLFFNLPKLLKKFDFIHIHGIWAPIQIISILYCCIFRIRFALHPHGMLLNEAINTGGIFKKLLKKICLFFVKFFQVEKIKFITITDQETNEIENYISKTEITLVPNPLPFQLYENFNRSFEKTFVYFGRMHPIKNISLIVKSFIESKLYNDGWRLDIFGIKDDEKYFLEIQELIKKYSQITIKDPIFGKEKQIIMKKSWCNILLSKSEVLSLSLIESSALGLPTIYPIGLDTGDYKESTFPVSENKESISQKFKEISQISKDKRQHIQKKIFENFLNIQEKSKRVFIETFADLYGKSQSVNTEKSLFEYLILSSGYIFNFFVTSFLVVLLALSKNYSYAADLGIIASFWITITQILSGNRRILILSETDNSKEIILKSTFFRIFTSLALVFIIINFFKNNLQNYFEINLFLIVSTSILILAQWINEILLSKKELENKLSYFYKIFFSYTVYLFLVSYFIFNEKPDSISYLNSLLSLFIIANIFNDLISFDFRNYQIWKLSNIFKFDLSYFSSFSLTISGFIWRIIVFNSFEKSLAGILYACFSVGSFPGTFFNNIIGPTYVKNKMRINNILKYFFGIILVSVLLSSLFYLNKISLHETLKESDYFGLTISLSLIGSFIMVAALYKRQKMIFEKKMRLNNIFYTDIISGLSIIFILPVMNFFGGNIFVSFSYLLASLVSFIFYSMIKFIE